jgi:formyltetrahydrofolate-dependent phosphoribosylglycinamide formyltransferase
MGKFIAKTAVLLSGSGRTLRNLLDRVREGTLDIEIRVVIADRPGIRGLTIAEEAGIPSLVVHPRDYEFVWEEYSRALTYELEKFEPDLIVMAGFLSLYRIPRKFENRVMNIHPALVPSFCGKGYYTDRVHRAVLRRGVKVSGCTVHFADNEYDHGPIILQKAVPVSIDDTPETLAARVFEKECEAYPEAIRLFTEGRLRVEGRRVRILGQDRDAAPTDEASAAPDTGSGS